MTVPIVSLNIESQVVSENQEQYTLTFNLSKPAPAGGLKVIFSEVDSDNAFGDLEFPPELTNAFNFESFDPVGEELARSSLTINEGAATASLTFTTVADDRVEGEETTTYTLIGNESYTVDPKNSVDTITITDLPTEPSTLNTYNLEWTGDNGYQVEGFFTFDSDLEGSLITENELNDLQLAVYNPNDELIQVFDYDFPVEGEFNFNFDSANDSLLQSGNFDASDGFDLGIDADTEIGTDFFSILSPEEGFPEGTVVLTDVDFGDIENADSLGIGAFDLLDRGGTLSVTPRLITDDLICQGQAESFI